MEKQINEMLLLHKGLTPRAARARALDLLDMVGIKNPEQRLSSYPHELSGGQRQRVMIAMALANEPDLLIADEPTTALDVTIQAQVLTLLKDLKARLGMAMLLITHDLGIVHKMADRVYVMHAGEVVESGTTREDFRKPAATPTPRSCSPPSLQGRPGARAGRCAVGNGGAGPSSVWFPIKAGVLRRTVDHIKAVDGISVNVRAGHTVGVVGESGSGKTTLGLALLRLQRSEGSIRFGEREHSGLALETAAGPFAARCRSCFQDPFGSLSPRMSIGADYRRGPAGAPARRIPTTNASG